MTPLALTQRLAPLENKPAGTLLIHEIYRSVQGESTFAGLPCIFVRLAVCDSRCVWCDTPHAFTQGAVWTLDAIVDEVLKSCGDRLPTGPHNTLVEITGGEPLVQPEALPLMARLADLGFTVLLETSGAHDAAPVDRRVHVIMDLKCPASGECERNYWPNLDVLKPTDQIKLVIASRADFVWSEGVIRRHRLDERFIVLLSAVSGAVTPLELANWLLDSGLNVRLQLQMHKYIWDPQARGV